MASLPPIDVPDDATGAGAFDAPAAGEPDPARFDYLLRLGDDSLILGQRLSEWCGHAPALEVDLSLANLALDLIGQATFLLNEAGACEAEGRDGDRLAFRRDVPILTFGGGAGQAIFDHWQARHGGRPA